MKVKKILGMLAVIGFLYNLTLSSDLTAFAEEQEEEKIYLSDYGFRGAVINQIEQYGGIVKNELPTAGQMESLERLELTGPEDPKSANISGLQYAVNVKQLHIFYASNVKDFRSLSDLTELEQFYYAIEGKDPGESEFTDIRFMSNMKKLKQLSFSKAVLDLSPLNDLEQLKMIRFENVDEVATVKHLVSRKTKELTFANPITYSKQFDDLELQIYSLSEAEHILISEDEKVITVSEIAEEAESIMIHLGKTDNEEITHEIRYEIPLVWY
ncbi:hypothetical protein I6N96_17645 [Enterococcus sp. BWM-S5]|uniref:Leucine-rich repeat domain-containing protein n=1 Tax=Enterococcus larvae TaxID=2794352 RepID=A0ABS4CNG6_9ENTE|nr:hypothetical protein [Enterococcus larvae]MBP1048120.1 hypothetical protein [Enterococcus larvae]